MISPQLLISATFGIVWSALAIYLLFIHHGPEHVGQFHLRTMGLLSALLAAYNALRFWLEWRRLRQSKQAELRDGDRTTPPFTD